MLSNSDKVKYIYNGSELSIGDEVTVVQPDETNGSTFTGGRGIVKSVVVEYKVGEGNAKLKESLPVNTTFINVTGY